MVLNQVQLHVPHLDYGISILVRILLLSQGLLHTARKLVLDLCYAFIAVDLITGIVFVVHLIDLILLNLFDKTSILIRWVLVANL